MLSAESGPGLTAPHGLTVRLSPAGQLPSSDSATAAHLESFLFKFSNLLWTSGNPRTPRVTYATICFSGEGLWTVFRLPISSAPELKWPSFMWVANTPDKAELIGVCT